MMQVISNMPCFMTFYYMCSTVYFTQHIASHNTNKNVIRLAINYSVHMNYKCNLKLASTHPSNQIMAGLAECASLAGNFLMVL